MVGEICCVIAVSRSVMTLAISSLKIRDEEKWCGNGFFFVFFHCCYTGRLHVSVLCLIVWFVRACGPQWPVISCSEEAAIVVSVCGEPSIVGVFWRAGDEG